MAVELSYIVFELDVDGNDEVAIILYWSWKKWSIDMFSYSTLYIVRIEREGGTTLFTLNNLYQILWRSGYEGTFDCNTMKLWRHEFAFAEQPITHIQVYHVMKTKHAFQPHKGWVVLLLCISTKGTRGPELKAGCLHSDNGGFILLGRLGLFIQFRQFFSGDHTIVSTPHTILHAMKKHAIKHMTPWLISTAYTSEAVLKEPILTRSHR